MENIVSGIIVTVACLAGYLLAYQSFRKEKYNLAVLLLVLCGGILYFYVSMDFYLHQWDERYHALVSKNLIRHPLKPTLYDHPLLAYDYRNWTGNHIWLHKQPVPLWTMALSMSVFGVNEVALRLPSIIMSSTGIWLVYRVGKYFFSRKTGFFSAFLFSVNGLIIEMTGGRVATDHVDISFMFYMLLAIFLTTLYAERRKTLFTILIGVSTGAAILTKWLTALIILPVWILIVTNGGETRLKQLVIQFLLLAATITAVFLPWQLYIYKAYPLEAHWEAATNLRHFTEVIEERSGPFYYYLDRIGMNYSELIYLPLLWFLVESVRNFRDRNRMALCIWFLVPLVVFSVAKTKMQGYTLFTAPVLFMMTSEFYYFLLGKNENVKYQWMIYVVAALFIILPLRYCYETVKPFEQQERNPEWAAELRRLNSEHIENGILLNYQNPVEAMFYTDLTAYPSLPGEDKIMEWLLDGHNVIINDRELPDWVTELDGVMIRKFSTADRD
jgi:4-amino-4-deoxy-L-arabinose transferase-like glycosyltransferase